MFSHLVRIGLMVMVLLVGAPAAFAVSGVDLNTWEEVTEDGNGFWDVGDNDVEGSGPDGFFVQQEVNGAPTIYASTNNFINTTIDGTFKVNTGGDNDFIGFVFGLNQPTTSSRSSVDTLLFDWKQGAQSGASAGFRLSYVTGDIINSGSEFQPYWTHSSTSDVTFQSLGTDTGTTRGWADDTEYNFSLAYTPDNIQIKIQGGAGDFATEQTIFDVDASDVPGIFPSGEFPTGKFGFYNFSQSKVQYEGFTQTEPALSTSPADGETLNFLARVGDSDSQAVTVTNAGGNGTSLTGVAGSPADPAFSGTGGNYSLADGDSTDFTYTYAPTARTDGVADTDAINVSSNDPNDTDGHDINFSGTAVGPVVEFSYDFASPGVSTVDTIDFDAVNPSFDGDIQKVFFYLANVTDDDNGGDSTLTDLTIVDYEITGADADKFYFVEDITGEVVNKGFINGYPLEFDPMGMMGTFDDAVLTITTDLGAAYGAAGEVFSFDLSATSTVIPEPGTALIGTLGLVGLGLRRRQVRRKPRTCASN